MFVKCLHTALMISAVAGLPSDIPNNKEKIVAAAQKMIAVMEEVTDFISETEVVYYKGGKEDTRYKITFFFNESGKFRIHFSRPFPGLTVFYKGGEQKLTVKPFRFLPLKLRFSINNSMVKTPSGQRIDQTDVTYFIQFLFKNLKWIEEEENEYLENDDRIEFSFYAMDYVEGTRLERYRVSVSKKNWLPLGMDSYDLQGTPIEIISFKNYTSNPQLEDEFFNP